MTASALDDFVTYCRAQQPQSPQAIARFFESVVGFPYDNELLLQAYLYLNSRSIFPTCRDLLLFEKAPIANRTDFGKCDLIYLTDDDCVFSIETKYIDTVTTGATERKRRNKHRNDAIDQALARREQLREAWGLPGDRLLCGTFTTDPGVAARLAGTVATTAHHAHIRHHANADGANGLGSFAASQAAIASPVVARHIAVPELHRWQQERAGQRQ